MKKVIIFLLLIQVSLVQYGQIIADHTVVDKYDDIPQYYIDEVKKMLVTIAGMSHSHGYYTGATLLEALDSRFQVVTSINVQPVPFPSSNALTLAKPWNTGATIWTSPEGIESAKVNQLNYASNNPYDAYIFGWSYQATWDNEPGGGLDPVYKVHWAGQTDGGIDGNMRWGLDAGDYALTGNRVCMDTYLDAFEQFIDYCSTHYPSTHMIFSTLIADGHEGTEAGFQRELKSEHIRQYVSGKEYAILFDFGDILTHNDAGAANFAYWNDGGTLRAHPQIHPDNLKDYDASWNIINPGVDVLEDHIGEVGALRIGKALWWMLARMAGWDGGAVIPSGTWLGVTNDWHNDSNWPSEVPTSTTDVIISSSVSKQPFIYNSPTALCNNLTIGTGASLTVRPGQSLTVHGNLSNSGTLNLESGVSVEDPIGLTLNGSMIVLGASTGNVTYKRQLRPKGTGGDLHFFSSPVGGQTITGFTAVNSTDIQHVESVYQIWEWKESDATWPIVSAGNFVTGKGYNLSQATEGDGLFAFTGSVVKSATFTASSPYLNGYIARATAFDYGLNNTNPIWTTGRSWINYGSGGWNLMGNPFTSAMDAAAFISSNTGKFDPYYEALYIYDGINEKYEYAAASIPGYPQSGSFGSVVQAGQGFFVLALYDKIVFNYNSTMQVHNTSVNLLKSVMAEEPWPGLQLKVRYGSKESITTIVYNSEMTAGLDPGYDVGLFSTAPDVEIYTTLVKKENSVNFARQALPVIDCNKIIVPVGIDSEKGGEVTFSAHSVPLVNYNFWLEDRKTGIFTDLNSNIYTATLPANTFGTGRFFIYASTNTPTAVKTTPEGRDIRVWAYNNKVIIKGNVSDRAFCEVYDLMGKKALEFRLAGGELNTVNIPSGSKGIYIVRVVDGTSVHNTKVLLL